MQKVDTKHFKHVKAIFRKCRGECVLDVELLDPFRYEGNLIVTSVATNERGFSIRSIGAPSNLNPRL